MSVPGVLQLQWKFFVKGHTPKRFGALESVVAMADTNQTADTGHETPKVDFGAFQEKFSDIHAQAEEYVRANPTPSFLSALGAGFILQLLPISAIVGALVRLAFFAIRPAIFIYGAVSLYKHYQHTDEQSR